MNQDFLSDILSDPEKLNKILSAATSLLGGSGAAQPESPAASVPPTQAMPDASPPSDPLVSPPAVEPSFSRPVFSERPETPSAQKNRGSPAVGENPFAGAELPDYGAGLFKNALPVISAINASGKNAVSREKMNLLSSIKPFVGPQISSEIDHAVRLVSIAKMAKAALKQLGEQQTSYGPDEI